MATAAQTDGRTEKPAPTRDRVLDAAVVAFGRRGYEGTSLDALAGELGVRKQTILYYFPSKEAVLEAAVDRAAGEVAEFLADSVEGIPPAAWDRIRAVVRGVFRLAADRPELLGLLREATRLGPAAATRFALPLRPLIDAATAYLDDAMVRGDLRRQDSRLLLLVAYSSVVGVVTEGEVLRVLGLEPTARSLVQQRSALLRFLRSALL